MIDARRKARILELVIAPIVLPVPVFESAAWIAA